MQEILQMGVWRGEGVGSRVKLPAAARLFHAAAGNQGSLSEGAGWPSGQTEGVPYSLLPTP